MTLFGSPNNVMYYRVAKDDAGKIQDGKATENVKTQTIFVLGGQQNGVKFIWNGSLEKNESVDVLAGKGSPLGIIGTLIVQFISLMFIWMAFISVGKMSKWAGKAIDSVTSLGKQVGISRMKQISLPFVGSVGGAMQIPQAIRNNMAMNEAQYHNDLTKSALGKMLGMKERDMPSNPNVNAAINSVTNNISVTGTNKDDVKFSGIGSLKKPLETIVDDKNASASQVQSDVKSLFRTMYDEANRKLEELSKQTGKDIKMTPEIWKKILNDAGLSESNVKYRDFFGLVDTNNGQFLTSRLDAASNTLFNGTDNNGDKARDVVDDFKNVITKY